MILVHIPGRGSYQVLPESPESRSFAIVYKRQTVALAWAMLVLVRLDLDPAGQGLPAIKMVQKV